MGYTHYWTMKPGAKDPERFKEAIDLFKELWSRVQKTFSYEVWDEANKTWKRKRFKKENLLKGWDGNGEPIITDTELRFNGDAKYGLDHETFSIGLKDFDEDWVKENGEVHDSCKTARKPYDLAVCLALLAFKKVFGKDFDYSSDGVTRENMVDPERLAYWERIEWTPKIEPEWRKAYRVYDDLMEHYRTIADFSLAR